jgi:hypothetical protein
LNVRESNEIAKLSQIYPDLFDDFWSGSVLLSTSGLPAISPSFVSRSIGAS